MLFAIVTQDQAVRHLYEKILEAIEKSGRKATLKRMDTLHRVNIQRFREQIEYLKRQIMQSI